METMENDNKRSYKGWGRLRPMDEDRLVPIIFPLDMEGRYTVGSRMEDPNFPVNLLVPDVALAEIVPDLPIQAILTVDDKGDVYLSRPDGKNADILVNGQVISAGQKRPTLIIPGSAVSFGPWQFVYKPPEEMLSCIARGYEINRCHVCNEKRLDGVRILPCGHNVCKSCVRRAMSQADWSGKRSCLLGMQNQAMRLFCSICRSRVTAGVANSSTVSITTTQMAKAMRDVDDLDGNRPLCYECENQRGLISSRDYHFCEQCRRIVCAACVLPWHQTHSLKPQTSRLRTLDSVEQRLEMIRKVLANLKQRQKEAAADPENQRAMRVADSYSRAVAVTMKSMSEKEDEYRQHVQRIQQRHRELALGWDETSRGMEVELNRCVREFYSLMEHLRRLRNGEASLTLSSASDEEEQRSILVEPPSTATPSATTSSQEEHYC